MEAICYDTQYIEPCRIWGCVAAGPPTVHANPDSPWIEPRIGARASVLNLERMQRWSLSAMNPIRCFTMRTARHVCVTYLGMSCYTDTLWDKSKLLDEVQLFG